MTPRRRRPAWCDRILYLDSSAAAVEQYWYSGVPGITFSDHRPVAAAFHVDVSGASSRLAALYST